MSDESNEVIDTPSTEPEYGDTRDFVADAIDKLDIPDDDAPAEPEAKPERERDEQGRFKAKESAEPVELDSLEEPEPIDETPQPEPIDLNRIGFNKEEIERLKDLPPETLQALRARDERYHNGIRSLKEQADIGRQFQEALMPQADYLKTLDVKPNDFIPALVQTEMVLRLGTAEQKAAMLQQLAYEYGVNLEAAAQQPFDPRMYQAQKERDYYQRKSQEYERSIQSQEQQAINAHIDTWAQDKQYFAEVKEDMALLLESGKAKNLDDAYDKALRLNDTTFQKAIQPKLLQEQRIKNDQAAKKARASAVSLNGAPVGKSVAPTFNSTEDAVRHAMQELGF